MATAIEDLAAKLNLSSLSLDEDSLGSDLADSLRRAFLGKALTLRDMNGLVSTETMLSFQATADLFLGVFQQPVRVVAIVHAGKIECVLIAKLPQRWDFSWAYPDLPDYIDNSDPSEEAKSSFFYDLRFGEGLTALFSSYDFSQTPEAPTDPVIEEVKSLDNSVNWSKVRQGLNYQGEIDLTALPFMGPLCEIAGVTPAPLPLYGALHHSEYDDEIRLSLGLSLDTSAITGDIGFSLGVTELTLSSSVSLFAPAPQSSIGFLGHINFGQSDYSVRLSWPIGGKQLILSNTAPIPFPGLDVFFNESDDAETHKALSGILSNNFEIREIVLGLSFEGAPSITSFRVIVASPENWEYSFFPEGLDDVFSVKDYLLRLDLRPRLEVTAEATFEIGGGIVHVAGIYPDLVFAGGLGTHQEIDVTSLLSLFLPSQGHDWLPSLKIIDLSVEADFNKHIYAFDIDITSGWEIQIGGPSLLPLRNVRLSLEKEQDWTSVSIDGLCAIAGVNLRLFANYIGDSQVSEWAFYGKTAPDSDIPFGELMKDLVAYIGGAPDAFPKALESFVVRNLRAEFHVGTGGEKDVKFHCEGEWKVATHGGDDLLIDLYVTVTRTTHNGTRITTFDGELTVGDLDFNVRFIDEATESSASDLLVATYSHGSEQQKLKLGDLLRSVVQDDTEVTQALDSVEIDLKDAIFGYSKTSEEKKFLFGVDISANLSLAGLPLVGSYFSNGGNASIDNLQALVAWKPFTESEVSRLNELLPDGVNRLPDAANGSNGDGSATTDTKSDASDPTKAIALREGFNIGATLSLGNISWPLSMPASNKPETPAPTPDPTPAPTPTPTPVQDSGKTPATTTTNNATWIKIQKSLGPVHFERIGAQYKDGHLSFLFDASLSVAGLTLSLDGLSIGSPINEFKPEFDLRGLGIDYRNDAVEIGGAFLNMGDNEYAGAAVIRAKQLTLSALGSYKQMENGPSVFVYAALDYPIGGPAFFYVTGLAAGFGYSRALTMPTIDQVADFPLIENARNGAGMPKDITGELQKLGNYITPAAGENFLAIGVKFTSFKIVDSFALLTVSFGNHFEINLLGISNLKAPANAGANVPPVAEAQLALKGTFQPDKGFLGIQAQLTSNSYLLSKACHLTGGFAFYSWFAGSEHDGDFALTLGGYHPDFKVPDHYPTVPRLGFNWQVSPELSLKGDAYFALTASALMAGGHLEANWRSGSIHAWFKVGADFLMAWQPYHYQITAYVNMGVEVTFEFFGTQHISIDVGADLRIWGPEFSGYATIHLAVVSFTVEFGAGASQDPEAIDWTAFKQSFLPEKAVDVCSVAVTGGLIGKDSQDTLDLGVINPKDFSLVTNSVIPSTAAQYEGAPSTQTFSKIGIAPMAIKIGELTSTHKITITRQGNPAGGDFEYTPIFKKVPAGLWGGSLKPELNGVQFIENALSGFEIRPAKKPAPTNTASIIRGNLQDSDPGEEGWRQYEWESVAPFVEAPFAGEEERRTELRNALSNGAAGRNKILEALGFTPEDLSRITMSAAQADDFLIAPRIERN